MSVLPPIHSYGFCGGPSHCKHDAPEPEQVVLCRLWLRRWAMPRKTLNANCSSYRLKHAVESTLRTSGAVDGIYYNDARLWDGWRTYGDAWARNYLRRAVRRGADRTGSDADIREANSVLGVA